MESIQVRGSDWLHVCHKEEDDLGSIWTAVHPWETYTHTHTSLFSHTRCSYTFLYAALQLETIHPPLHEHFMRKSHSLGGSCGALTRRWLDTDLFVAVTTMGWGIWLMVKMLPESWYQGQIGWTFFLLFPKRLMAFWAPVLSRPEQSFEIKPTPGVWVI